MRQRTKAIVAVAGVGAAAAIFTSIAIARTGDEKPATQAPETQPPVVMVETVELQGKGAERRLAGTIRARTEADLGFRVAGKLLSRSAEVGSTVYAGDVVAALDDTDLRLQEQAAEAAQAAARIALQKAEVDLTRVTTLEKKGWASGQASDERTVNVEELRARLLQAERTVELARNALGYATLRADADGVVLETFAEAGQVLEVGQPVVRIARAGAREAVVGVPETLLGGLGSAPASASLWSVPGQRLPVTLRQLSPVADSATRTFEARFSLPADAAGAALGSSVTVTLSPTEGPGSVELPLAALIDTGGGPQVWVVGADGRLAARPVVVEAYAAETVRIASGLDGGERVVVLGAQRLKAGEAVRTMAAEG